MVTLKRRARSGPDDWVLRGAARPWESLDDGTLDPNGRPYDVVETGVDLFSLPGLRGAFGVANTSSHAHVTHLRELAAILATAGVERKDEALAMGAKALQLDATDGAGRPPTSPHSGREESGGEPESAQLKASEMVRLLLGFGTKTAKAPTAAKAVGGATGAGQKKLPPGCVPKPMPNAPRPTKKARLAAASAAASASGGVSSVSTGNGGGTFVPAATFKGARAGMSFKKGPKGVGYYADGNGNGNAAASAASAAALTRAAALSAVASGVDPAVLKKVLSALRSAAPGCTAAAAGALLVSLVLESSPASPPALKALSDPVSDLKALFACNPYALQVLASPLLFAEAAAAAARTAPSSPIEVVATPAAIEALMAQPSEAKTAEEVDVNDSDDSDDSGSEAERKRKAPPVDAVPLPMKVAAAPAVTSMLLASRSTEWGQAGDALRYSAREERVWAWALGDADPSGDGGPREFLHRFLKSKPAASWLEGHEGSAGVISSAPDAQFPAARRFGAAWDKQRDLNF
eukprot:CAMPEP_0171940046 /NCGR_PEP_ID=MMETSP0993-20121228/36747_1 /TAXON_ID=483369 /ORGANISM="non described non described, Strain CCMP2098" /LENGTH=519 /DNA_ID=CAMNT_0012581987 /DNA_START=18 /DNA_END=1577 /DNA_ORIENTATION=+